MAYRSRISARQKGGAIAAVIAVHAALLIAFLNISGRIDPGHSASALSVIDIRNILPERPKPPPRPPVRTKTKPQRRPPKKSSASSQLAPTLETGSRPVAETVTQAANEPAAVTAPASPAPGPGTGAPGSGTGSGGGGNGSGGGGDGVASPPRLLTPPLSSRDVSNGHPREWPPRATIFLRLRIDNRGYIAECLVDRGSGVASIDGAICNLARDRLRFSPALNYHGEAVAGWVGYAQPAPR